jgi:hypothetical protein
MGAQRNPRESGGDCNIMDIALKQRMLQEDMLQ